MPCNALAASSTGPTSIPLHPRRLAVPALPGPIATTAAAAPATVRPTLWFELGDHPPRPPVARLGRILAENGPLRLAVRIQVNPIDGVGALAFLGPLDARAAQPRARRLGRVVHRVGDLVVFDHAVDLP